MQKRECERPQSLIHSFFVLCCFAQSMHHVFKKDSLFIIRTCPVNAGDIHARLNNNDEFPSKNIELSNVVKSGYSKFDLVGGYALKGKNIICKNDANDDENNGATCSAHSNTSS